MSATTPPPRQRVIDDSDPAIQYGPNGWFVADPSTLNGGNFGPIYQDTSHATTSSNSNLTFAFNGTSIKVLGTIMVSIDSNNVTDPTWDCFVDEIKISNPNPNFKFTENNWVLCEQPQIAAGSHVLTIQVQSKGRAFYFDYLMYTPPPDASFDTAVLLYPTTDPSVKFGTGWRTFGGENGTNDFGSEVSLAFHGTSVSPYGFVPTELSHNATWATYTIDGGPPVNFTLSGLPSPQSSTEYFVTLFTTPTIQSGPHSLVITYGGDNQHTPLVIQGFYVTNTTSASDLASPSPSPSTPAGAIAGGVIGGLLLLGLLTALAFFCAKRRHRRDLTSPNPYSMSNANSGAPTLPLAGSAPPAGQPYAYSAVPASSSSNPLPATGAATAATSSSGSAAADSRPSTAYPSLHRIAQAPLHQHPSDTMSSSRGTHTHQLSGSSSSAATQYPTYGNSTSAVISHDSGSGHGVPLTSAVTLPPLPPKLARERAATQRAAPPLAPGTVVLRHEDSGVRLRVPESGAAEIVELPPGYSPD
ncbi:hypothetical protein B0H14DRAFT_2765447 [Mycena olivaceomarginata]|nr:hypothetical protein B0H14DRAFT_2765447 [Mycena olivaceomarginata]